MASPLTVEVPGKRSIPDSTRSIEVDFPFEAIGEIAEIESWRKEIYRPVYHMHKWWAQRLGSVFRAIILASALPAGSDVVAAFYDRSRLPGTVVFDPFMGSGTTIGESLKLGARAIGRDVNPVAFQSVRNALRGKDRAHVLGVFHELEDDLRDTIQHYYKAELPSGGMIDVLYFFWVMTVPCPACECVVDLFTSYVFAKHAYAKTNPEAHLLCPGCGAVQLGRYDADQHECTCCSRVFNPQVGPAKGARGTCNHCHTNFPIAKTIKATGVHPRHRMYAKLVLYPDGTKEYQRIDPFDLRLYDEARRQLAGRKHAFPVVAIQEGYNTNQALNYGYKHWHEMFNVRQTLCLSIIAERLQAIEHEPTRELFTCLFSGALEFNNMFASYKGEGTGAVRHMFSHHILKPERMALEANVWGTPKSSGSFSTLFSSRLLRAIDYTDHPFEIRVARRNGKLSGDKVYGLSDCMTTEPTDSFSDFKARQALLYVSCGDSGTTDVASESVDLIVTDPPFFDNVHYSQLADFFYVWQRYILGSNTAVAPSTTRHVNEVQQTDVTAFTEKLERVFSECERVLRPSGLLVFTYHHSRSEGWSSVLRAIVNSRFEVIATHPIKAEMSVAQPKQQAKEPIDLDMIIVCRKQTMAAPRAADYDLDCNEVERLASHQVSRYNRVGRFLSKNDVRIIVMGQLIIQLSRFKCWASIEPLFQSVQSAVDAVRERLWRRQQVYKGPEALDELCLFSGLEECVS